MYKHGSSAQLMPSDGLINPKSGAIIPVYVGVAPVHQLETAVVNEPILINNFMSAVATVGYNDSNWKDFGLCEAVYAHFKNAIGPIGPIVCINVLDPTIHKTAEKSAAVALTSGIGQLLNDKVILNTVEITGKTRGVDFSAAYNSDGSGIEIKALKELASPVTIKFFEVDLERITVAEIKGGVIGEDYKGIASIQEVYPKYNVIPSLILAPGWSKLKSVRDELNGSILKINGHWDAFALTDLPADNSVNTIEKAITYKRDNGFNGAYEKTCWPKAKKGTKIFHLSTLTAVEICRQALFNGGYPNESPSNNKADITAICLDDGKTLNYDQTMVNGLNEKGISSAVYFGGEYVLWGPHTAAYSYGKAMDPADIFDCTKLMLNYIVNDFQVENARKIDRNMRRTDVDTILNNYQERMDRMPLSFGKIEFLAENNAVDDMVSGDFLFDIKTTPNAVGKSISANVRYSTVGFKAMFGGA